MKPSRALIVAFLLTVAVIAISAQNGAPPRVPGIDTAGMDRSVQAAGRLLPLRQRHVGRQDADSGRPPELRHVRDAARALRRRRCAASSKRKRSSRPRPGRSGRRSAGSTRASWTTRASRRSASSRWPRNWRPSAASRACATCRRRSRGPRASAFGCRSPSASARTRSTPTCTPCSISQAGLGMPDRDYYLRTGRTIRRDSQGLHGLHRPAVHARQSEGPERRRRAHPRARDDASHSSSGIARATAIATPRTTR